MVYRHQPRRHHVLRPPHRRLPRARSRCPPRRRVPKRLSLMHNEFIEQWPQSLVQEVSECGDHHRRFAIARRDRIFSRVAPSRVPSDRPDAARTIIHRCKPIARAHLHRARALVRARSSHRARAFARTVIARTAWSRRRRDARRRASEWRSSVAAAAHRDDSTRRDATRRARPARRPRATARDRARDVRHQSSPSRARRT